MKPTEASRKIESQIPFVFSVYGQFPVAWRKLNCRPPTDSNHPERTDERYCIYDQPRHDVEIAIPPKVVLNAMSAS